MCGVLLITFTRFLPVFYRYYNAMQEQNSLTNPSRRISDSIPVVSNCSKSSSILFCKSEEDEEILRNLDQGQNCLPPAMS
jgi:hypothetical protein